MYLCRHTSHPNRGPAVMRAFRRPPLAGIPFNFFLLMFTNVSARRAFPAPRTLAIPIDVNKEILPMTRSVSHMIACMLATLVVLPGTVARAQTREATPEELAARADVVAVGRVSMLAPHWNADHSRIFTTVTLAVDSYLKGNQGGPLNILVPGGEVDGVGEIYSHTATFRKDEDVLVFVQKDARGNYTVSGGPGGKLNVTKDERTGSAFVGNRPLADVASAVKNAITRSTQKQ